MINDDRRDAVKKFTADWLERGSEKSDAYFFWIALLRALGVDAPETFIQSEVPVDVDGHAGFIDILIPSTRVLIEHKSRDIDLSKPARQSDGKFLTPFEQALRYADALPYSGRPRWIVVCNFVELRVYDMDRYHQRRDESYAPNVIMIERLAYEYQRLNFLVDPDDENVNPALKISKEAGEIVGAVYRAFGDVDPVELNKLCVRLVFCLYAEDSGIFNRNQFTDYLRSAPDIASALRELFVVLNTPIKERVDDLSVSLKHFPFVGGTLFAEDRYEVPAFNRATTFYLLTRAKEFDWSGISPTIFGALFESTLNPSTRRAGGMHYTSLENIHRLIDPLFLDALHDEFKTVRRKRKNRRRALEEFQLKLAGLKIFDPACGSGNFLTETYLSLRRLENEVIRELRKLGTQCSILVSIENFFGIEINDFAVSVARTALWIAENQMLQETEMIIHEEINFLPLTSAAHIVEGNALKLNWSEIAPRGVDYIIGNPPFVGTKYQSARQKSDVLSVCRELKSLDYVACWFKRAADFMRDTDTRAAFVSTNSITQGEQVAPLWRALGDVHIDFARRTFRWTGESDNMASVNCVIVGFSHAPSTRSKIIFDGDKKIIASNINGYLLDASDVLIESRTRPIRNVPKMFNGNVPLDGDALKIEADEYEEFLRAEPRAKKYIRRLIGGRELINGLDRYVLWLVEATEDDLQLPLIAKRVELCRQRRLAMTDKGSIKLAATPTRFRDILNPDRFIAVPRVSSGNRKYIPMGFFDGSTIATNQVLIIPEAGLYEFGVLESIVHMAWMRTTAGYLGTSYRYSKDVVYNNFPWASATEAQRLSIEGSARRILDAREKYSERTLAELYDPLSMPEELRLAHEENDRLVEALYGFEGLSEEEMAGRLMSMNESLR